MGWPHLLLYLRTVDKNEQRTVYARSLLEITRSPGETDDSPLRPHATVDWVLASSSQHWTTRTTRIGDSWLQPWFTTKSTQFVSRLFSAWNVRLMITYNAYTAR